jgi:isopentenyldiphosphate isomerase
MADTMLDIVDENDQIIGQALRSKIHTEGLRHREIHVWFITPDKQIIFQKRAADKEIAPNLLDATVGGHVELGMTYQQTAFEEIAEETGLDIKEQDIIFIDKYKSDDTDAVTGKINNVFRSIYAYVFKGNLSELQIEDGAGVGFKSYPLKAIYDAAPELHNEAVLRHIEPEKYYIYEALEKLVS